MCVCHKYFDNGKDIKFYAILMFQPFKNGETSINAVIKVKHSTKVREREKKKLNDGGKRLYFVDATVS